MTCRYSLWLQYSDQKFYLAPRFSIAVEEESDFETVNYGGGCCGDILGRDWHFGVKFVGNCSLASAFALNAQLQAFLDKACDDMVDLILYRRVCDETALQYKVSKPRVHMVDTITQFTRQRILSMDLIVALSQWPPDNTGVVEVGP